MLGYVIGTSRGSNDRLLAQVATTLEAEGWPLAGVVQINCNHDDPARPCDMDLRVLGGADLVRISQSLGPLSQGCRLDPLGLETAVGLVGARMAQAPRLLILNKFGKAEAEGRGFRNLIGEALGAGVSVLLGVTAQNQGAFEDFAGEFAQLLPADLPGVLNWCRTQPAP